LAFAFLEPFTSSAAPTHPPRPRSSLASTVLQSHFMRPSATLIMSPTRRLVSVATPSELQQPSHHSPSLGCGMSVAPPAVPCLVPQLPAATIPGLLYLSHSASGSTAHIPSMAVSAPEVQHPPQPTTSHGLHKRQSDMQTTPIKLAMSIPDVRKHMRPYPASP
jgi:hypothetical protein